MAFTVKNIVDGARPLVADTTQPYRWTDAQLKEKVNEGVQEIFTLRPDSTIDGGYEAPDELDALYDEVPLRPVFKTALIYYVASSLLMQRASDKSLRIQGMDYRKLFQTLVGS